MLRRANVLAKDIGHQPVNVVKATRGLESMESLSDVARRRRISGQNFFIEQQAKQTVR